MKMLGAVVAVAAAAVCVGAIPPAVLFFDADMKVETSMSPTPMDTHVYYDQEAQKLRIDAEMGFLPGMKSITIDDFNESISYIITEAWGQVSCRQCYLEDELYPMVVPPLAVQDGTDTVNGETCDVWRFALPMAELEFCTQQSGHYAVLRSVMRLSNGMMTIETTLTFSNHNFARPSDAIWETNTTCEKPKKCNAPVNVVLLMDGSGSINSADFVRMKEFARMLVTNFTLSTEAANIALVQFSNTARVEISLSADQAQVLRAINNMRQIGDSTNMDAGLRQSLSVFRNSKRNVNKVLVMFTDGRPDSGNNPVAVAQTLKDDNIEVYTVGVGSGVDPNLLKKIANEDVDPQRPHYLQAESFTKLLELVSNIVSAGCKGDKCTSQQ